MYKQNGVKREAKPAIGRAETKAVRHSAEPRSSGRPMMHSSAFELEKRDRSAMLDRFVRDFSAGAISAIVSKTMVAPVERVKLLLQLQHASPQLVGQNHYKGMMDCFVRIQTEEGLASYWRGNVGNIMRHFPMQALSFALNDAYRRVFVGGVRRETNFGRWVAGNLLSGGLAGVSTMAATYPLDYARTRVTADVGIRGQREFHGLLSCLQKTFQTDGARGLFRGSLASVPYVFLHRATYFGLFETLQKELLDPRRFPSDAQRFAATWAVAQSVTMVATLVSYPFDTVRRRMMMQSGYSRSTRLYDSTLECWRATVAKEGLAGLYKGFAANLVRSIGSALILAVYEEVQRHFDA